MVAKLKLFTVKKHEKQLTSSELKVKELIKRRRLQILVHSCIYYNFNDNIISDETFNKWSKELVNLQKDNPEISKDVEYYEAFKNFDGSTGFDLPYEDDWVVNKAQQLLRYKENKNE